MVVKCATGREVVDYPSGQQGIPLNAADHHLARQNPADSGGGASPLPANPVEPVWGLDGIVGFRCQNRRARPVSC